MNVEEQKTHAWSTVDRTLVCEVEAAAFDPDFDGTIEVQLQVEEVLEELDGRRVLTASAHEVVDDDECDPLREAVLHPTYLIEETTHFDDDESDVPDDVGELVRAPLSVEVDGEIQRSIFVDNVGISIGELVDLVRGELEWDQIRQIFSAVAELFVQLHDAGWVHLGLTPWNIRIFDEDCDDGFPRALLASSLGQEDDDLAEASSDDGSGDEGDAADEDVFGAVSEEEFAGRERTVVELAPLGEEDTAPSDDDKEPSETDTDEQEPSEQPDDERFDEDEGEALSEKSDSVSWSELAGDTSAADEVDEAKLAAILDGVDRLYPVGEVEDEMAVTPGFSAPELLSGMGSDDGTSADVFSLGMLLYFLVAGVVPPASVYTRYAPAIPARNFRPGFPPGLQPVIARATRPNPEDRYASVGMMLDAFEDACEVMRHRQEFGTASPPTMNLASDTHIGIAKRERNPTNQDSVFSASSDDGHCALIVVADGVSTASYGSGDLASTALVEEAKQVWEEALPAYLMDEELDEVEIIQSILTGANQRIVDHVNEHHTPFRGSPHEVMGSTALVTMIVDGQVTLASLGDSRAYLQRGAEMEQITIDHNLWTLSILEGVEADSALAMPHGDALARCLGTFVVDNGTLNAVEPQPDLFRFQVMEKDTLLLTTDGLVDFAGTNLLASEDNILSVLLAEPDPALACLELILLANRGGGGDNIGLSVIRFE